MNSGSTEYSAKYSAGNVAVVIRVPYKGGGGGGGISAPPPPKMAHYSFSLKSLMVTLFKTVVTCMSIVIMYVDICSRF